MITMAIFASLFNYGSNWNLILFIIIGCSVASFTIFVERLMQLHRSEINTNQFIIRDAQNNQRRESGRSRSKFAKIREEQSVAHY